MDRQRARSARIVVAGALALALAGASPPLQVTPDVGGLRVSVVLDWGEAALAFQSDNGNPPDHSNAGGNGNGNGGGSDNSNAGGNPPDHSNAGGNGGGSDNSNAGGGGGDNGGGGGNSNSNGGGNSGGGNGGNGGGGDGGNATGHGGGNSSDGRGGGEQTTEPQTVMGPSLHPSGKDRTEEPGGSGTQGSSPSDPDGDFNYGADKPGGTGGIYTGDQDGNNGCGNDQDFEDDNRGNCGGLRRGIAPPGGDVGGDVGGVGGEVGGVVGGVGGVSGSVGPSGVVGGVSGGVTESAGSVGGVSGGSSESVSSSAGGGVGGAGITSGQSIETSGAGGGQVGGAGGELIIIGGNAAPVVTESESEALAPEMSEARAIEALSVGLGGFAPIVSGGESVRIIEAGALETESGVTSKGVESKLAGAAVRGLPSTGVGAMADFASGGLLLLFSGVAALGALGTRRSRVEIR